MCCTFIQINVYICGHNCSYFQKNVSTCKLCRRPDDIANLKKKKVTRKFILEENCKAGGS